MKVEIVQIADRGKPSNERIHLRVLVNTNMQYYIIFDSTYTSPNAISNKQRHAFWFPPHPVRAGDNVILVTGVGTQRHEPNTQGGTNHFFFWGLDRTIWNNTGDCAVLFEVSTWQASKYE
ncbi:MAG: hypothetical protein AABN34_18010 [Acidobacteriota bacterium]